jgi:hydrogenase nickel incorporation protein HypA/HybF
MHEKAVTESLLNIATEHALKAGASRVTQLNLVIGRLSSIVGDSVQFYWDVMSNGTICEGSKLIFKRVPAELYCLNCGNTYGLDSDLQPCPKCGSSQVNIKQGEEFYLDSIEIEQNGEPA